MGLDLSTDDFTEEEKERMLKWYREVHDHGDLDLAPFSRFMLEHDPTGFKRLRRHLITLEDELDGPPLPVAAGVLMFVHTYIVLGMGKGALYEIIAMRELGASRDEVMETVRLAALHGGPRGINALAEVADDWTTCGSGAKHRRRNRGLPGRPSGRPTCNGSGRGSTSLRTSSSPESSI